MILTANDVRTRVALTRLLVKIENDPESGRRIGVEDASRLRPEACAACYSRNRRCVTDRSSLKEDESCTVFMTEIKK